MRPPEAWSADEMKRSLYQWVTKLKEISNLIQNIVPKAVRMPLDSTSCVKLANGPLLSTAVASSMLSGRGLYDGNDFNIESSMGSVDEDSSGRLTDVTLSNGKTPQLLHFVVCFHSFRTYTNSPLTACHAGVKMPILGLGTWQMNGEQCEEAVYAAIEKGYRHIDGAQAYGNDVEIGRAVSRAIIAGITTREQLFIANKVSFENDMGYEGTRSLVVRQLHDLGLQYFDLYMIHSPLSNKQIEEETWLALQDMYTEGIIKSIGLSNYGSTDLTVLLNFRGLQVKPMVIQNKLDIYHVGKQIDPNGDHILHLAKTNGIKMVAYSPLSAFPFIMQPADDPIVRSIAHRMGGNMTPSTIVLRWVMQQGIAVIPRYKISFYIYRIFLFLTLSCTATFISLGKVRKCRAPRLELQCCEARFVAIHTYIHTYIYHIKYNL